ncbi:MAG: CAP domain-containing protein [Chitinispirillaceae bacterium]|nr:CAP domain-containing protein [Chitinispirillaceae bacterium]
MKRKTAFFILILFYFISVYSPSVFGYGEKVDTLLLWQERSVAVLTNACRMAPTAFRDRYIGNNTILLPENYPAVPPLYWNRELNAAARFHCVEMGLICGMTHDCNGVSFSERVKEFYTKSGYIGENIAAGYQPPQDVVNAWLIDGRSAAQAAPDGNGDGHRANIMSPRFRELGCGYFLTGSGRNATSYWCQDFGGGRSDFTYHPVCAASHVFFSKERITFLANLYDTAGTVSHLSLILDETSQPMALDMGTASAGTWAVTLPTASACRNYAVEVGFNDGHTLRYPEEGTLLTVGEGSCIEGETALINKAVPKSVRRIAAVTVQRRGEHLIFSALSGRESPVRTDVIDGKGLLRCCVPWKCRCAEVPMRRLPPGLYFLRHSYRDGSVQLDTHIKGY